MKIGSIAVLLLLNLILCAGANAEMAQTDDGAIIYYEVKGKGPPIVLVHGWTMSGKVWQKQVAELSKHYQVVTVDLRAHGNSSKVVYGHTVPRYAKDVRSVISKLKLKKVILVGWSLGGPVVLSYWEQFGSKGDIRAIGLVDSDPFPFSAADWNAHGLKNYAYDKMNATFLAFTEKRREAATQFINKMFKSGQAGADLDWILTEHLKTPISAAISIYSDYLMRDYAKTLKTVTVPVIVFAADSQIYPNPNGGIAMGKYVSSQLPKSTFVPFEDAGHMLFYEQPDKFNRALEGFIKGIK